MDVGARGEVIRRLADGSVVRRAGRSDADRLARFQGAMQSDEGPAAPDDGVAAWTRDLLAEPHPTFDPSRFLFIEDPRSGAVVSALCTIPQIWSYEGVPLSVGRVELVATAPEARRQRLVAALFSLAHADGQEHGEAIQAITGIPWFYRQFGYEMALELADGRIAYPTTMPADADGKATGWRLRPAARQDIPALAAAYDASAARHGLHCERGTATWEYELTGRSPDSVMKQEIAAIEVRDGGETAGFLAHDAGLHRGWLSVSRAELLPGHRWIDAGPSILRALAGVARGRAREAGSEWRGVVLRLGTEHPAYGPLADALPGRSETYAWYLRVADLPGLIDRIAPALERRLAASDLAGWSGGLALGFYRTGLRLTFEAGRLSACAPLGPAPDEGPDAPEATFPDLTFLQLLFGFRSLDELMHAFPDCRARRASSRHVLRTLFPKRASPIWPLG